MIAAGRDFVAGRLQRTGAAPAPNQNHLPVGRVVEAVPMTPLREHDVAFASLFVALVGVDHAMAFEYHEELIGMEVTVAVVPGAGGENGPSEDQLVRTCLLLVNEELYPHVDPAVFGGKPSDMWHLAEIGAVGSHLDMPPRRR